MGGRAPAPPPVPKDPSTPPDRNEEEVKAAQTLERKRQLSEKGRASTLLTKSEAPPAEGRTDGTSPGRVKAGLGKIKKENLKVAKLTRGRAANVLTSNRGLGSIDDDSVARKTLGS